MGPNLFEIPKPKSWTEKCRLSLPRIFSSPENVVIVAAENSGSCYLLMEIRNLRLGYS